MIEPPYFRQEHRSACSLAVLRSVLALSNRPKTEHELIDEIKSDYGNSFKNIWNPTIAKLAALYGVNVLLSAEWPLLKPENLEDAIEAFNTDRDSFRSENYENITDSDHLPEPLSLAYREMFAAINAGCRTKYGALDEDILREVLSSGNCVQTSIKTKILYPDAKSSFHSILLYKIAGDTIWYHDPARLPAMHTTIAQLLGASNGTGAFLVYTL